MPKSVTKKLGKAEQLPVADTAVRLLEVAPVVSEDALDRKQEKKSLKRKSPGPKLKKAAPRAKKVAAVKKTEVPQTEVKKL